MQPDKVHLQIKPAGLGSAVVDVLARAGCRLASPPHVSTAGEALEIWLTLPAAAPAAKSVHEDEHGAAMPGPAPVITAGHVITVVCAHYKAQPSAVCGQTRLASVVLPRHIIAYFLAELAGLSSTASGAVLGGRDHSTVTKALQSLHDRLNTEPVFRATISDLKNKIIATATRTQHK